MDHAARCNGGPIVDNKRTGLLLDDPPQPGALGSAMCWMLEHGYQCQQMREAASAKAHELHSKSKFEESLHACICESVANERVPA